MKHAPTLAAGLLAGLVIPALAQACAGAGVITRISGRHSAIGTPGNPAPEPKSSSVPIPQGNHRAHAIDSTKCRRRIPSRSRIADRFMRAFQRP